MSRSRNTQWRSNQHYHANARKSLHGHAAFNIKAAWRSNRRQARVMLARGDEVIPEPLPFDWFLVF